MMSKENGGPAFPIGSGDIRDPMGMTLRDWFAGKALAGMMSIPYPEGQAITNESIQYDAALCYSYADAMLAERSKE